MRSNSEASTPACKRQHARRLVHRGQGVSAQACAELPPDREQTHHLSDRPQRQCKAKSFERAPVEDCAQHTAKTNTRYFWRREHGKPGTACVPGEVARPAVCWHTLLVEVLVGLGWSRQELAQRARDGEELDVGRARLASYHSAHSRDQISCHRLRLHTKTTTGAK